MFDVKTADEKVKNLESFFQRLGSPDHLRIYQDSVDSELDSFQKATRFCEEVLTRIGIERREGFQDATDLRVAIEGLNSLGFLKYSKMYIGKTHLLAALYNLGFRIKLDNDPYFSVQANADACTKAINKLTKGAF